MFCEGLLLFLWSHKMSLLPSAQPLDLIMIVIATLDLGTITEVVMVSASLLLASS